ncbi:hypothetical protein [Deinococcus knuensis]|uniref:Tail terminator n=1 Tax=Deinococcus knuensis TaxID=1837380 RepID=A0ABQ2SRV0_9DEIO|nr:hypothetical protein [Deinococcus knuensis]GGS37865.1 hypothetical protein GCM10008961_31740 [Deinococcus knuensis]
MLDDLTRRLQAALPATVPVLPPEQILLPAEWQEEDASGDLVPNGERGLHVYLRQQAPDGYVQIETPEPITTTGNQDTYWTAVAAIAGTAEQAAALATQIRTALTGTPPADPGWYKLVIPARHAPIAPGAHLARATYTRTLLLGQLPN